MTELAYAEAGSGADVLVLLHGFPLTSAMWREQMEALASDGWRVIAPDLPGFGRTPGAMASVDEAADAVASMLDRLGVERVVFAGFSMGGYVGFAFARRHGTRLRALMLIDTRSEPDSEEGRRGRYTMAERARNEGADAIVEAMLPRLLSDSTREGEPEVVHAVLDVASGATVEGIIGALQAMAARPSSTPDLTRINVPVLVIVGQEDALAPVAESEAMTAALPDARLAVIPDSGHTTPMEQPEAVTAVMREFLARIRTGQRAS